MLTKMLMIRLLFLKNMFLLFKLVIFHNNIKLVKLDVNLLQWMKIYYFKDYKNMEVKNWRQFKKNFYGKKH